MPAENEDRDRRLNRARRSCVHGLPLRELGGPVAVRFPVDWSLKAPRGGNLEKKTKEKRKKKALLGLAADTKNLILLHCWKVEQN